MIFKDTKIAFYHLTNWQVLGSYWLFNLIGSKQIQKILFPVLQGIVKYRLPFNFLIKPAFNHFFCGESLDKSIQIIRNIAKRHIYTIVHYGVELKKTEKDFDKTFEQIMYSIEFAHEHLKVKVISCKVTGLGDACMLEKIQAGESLTSDEKIGFEKLQYRISQICKKATEYHLNIYWDAEESWIQKTIDQLVIAQMAIYNTDEVYIFNTYQLYLTNRLEVLKKDFSTAKLNNYKLGAKLVRGAYLQKENDRALSLNETSPVYHSKQATDIAYDAAIHFCISHIKDISVCIASHNEESTEYTLQLMQQHGIKNENNHLWFSQLYGMSEHISNNLAHLGYNVAKYTPYGEITDALPYLIRRAEENSSSTEMISREIDILKSEINRRSIETGLK